MNFADKLYAREQHTQSQIGLRLDILAAKMPLPFARTDDPMLPFAQAIIDATRDLVAAYVIDPAYYFSEGAPGMIALERITRYVPADIPIVLDTRCGPLGDSAMPVARGAFEAFRADAITFSAPPDARTLDAFLNYPDKLLFIPGIIATSDQIGVLIETGEALAMSSTNTLSLIREKAYRVGGKTAVPNLCLVESTSDLIYTSRRDDFADVLREAIQKQNSELTS
jgi:hypothetical protein